MAEPMNPDKCPHCVKATKVGLDGAGRVVHCRCLSDAIGWSHAVAWSFCERCIAGGDYMTLAATSNPRLKAMMVMVLAGRFKALGEHNYGEFGLEACLQRYGALAGEVKQRRLFKDAVQAWATNDYDPLPIEMIEAEAQALAKEFGFEDVLTEIEGSRNE